MNPGIMFMACGFLLAFPERSVWLLPAYAALLAWNQRPWLAFLVFVLFAGLRG